VIDVNGTRRYHRVRDKFAHELLDEWLKEHDPGNFAVKKILPLHWLTGPILTKELRVASRRKRTYALRLIYLAVVALILVPIWARASGDGYYDYDTTSAVYRMADLGRTIVPAIVWIQYIAVQLVAMLSMSTSVSDEIARRTLGALLTTPMTAWQLVMGKLASRLVQCVGLIAMSLPILALLTVFGGVQWSFVLSGLALTLSTMLIVSSVTMVFSILNRRPYVAFLEGLLTLGVLLGGTLLLGVWIAEQGTSRTRDDFFALGTIFYPFISLFVETVSQSWGSRGMGFGGIWLAPWWVCVLCNVAFSGLVLALCVRIVRHASQAAAMGMSMSELWRMDDDGLTPVTMPTPTPATDSEPAPEPPLIALLTGTSLLPPLKPRDTVPAPASTTVPPPADTDNASPASMKTCSGNPVYWKDTVRRRFRMRTVLAVYAVIGLLLFSYFAIAATNYDSEFPRGLHRVYVAALGILGGLAAVVVSAGAIPAEREARTWDMVLASPITNGQMVWGKFFAVLRRVWPAYIPLGLHVGLFTLTDALHPAILLHVAMIVAGSATFIAAVGVWIGTWARTTTAAMVLLSLLMIVLWAGAPLLVRLVEDNVMVKQVLCENCGGCHEETDNSVSEALTDSNPVVQLVVTGKGSADLMHDVNDHSVHTEWLDYEWPSGDKNLTRTTLYILLYANGYMILAILILLLAQRRVRRAKA